MIKKLSEYKITSRDGSFINVECNTKIINTLVQKINELIDTVNNQQIQLNNHECRLLDLHNRITALDDPTCHEAEPTPAENVPDLDIQLSWIGCLCRFRHALGASPTYGILGKISTNSDFPYYKKDTDTYWKYCEPVKPDDDIIFKGE